MDYKTEIIHINGVELEIIIEADGTKWYPVTQFFKKVLLKKNEANDFAKKQIARKMKAFPYKSKFSNVTYRWYMDEATIKKVLKYIKIDPYSTKTIERERALFGAQDYFGVERKKENKNMYAMITPTKKDYTEWELLCFQFDTDILANIIWKMCDKCGRYFPNSKYYFSIKRYYYQLENTCLECCGEEFKNKNQDIQTLKECNRMDLIKYIQNDNPVDLFLALRKQHFPYELMYFRNRTRLLQVLKYLEKERNINKGGGFYLANIALVLNMNLARIKNLIGDSYEIGVNKPLEQHKYNHDNPNLTEEEQRKKDILEKTKAEKKILKHRRDSLEHYRREKIKNTKINIQKTKDLILWFKHNLKDGIDMEPIKKYIPTTEYVFFDNKGLHIICREKPIDKMKVFIHNIPSRTTQFDKFKKALMEDDN